MVALVVKEQKTEKSPQYISNPPIQPIIIPRETAWQQDYKPPGREHSSAFRPVNSEHRGMVQQMLSNLEHPDDTTQVTWSSVHNYRCSVSVSGNSRYYWKQPHYEEISNDSKPAAEDDEDEEIDVGSSYDTEISIHSMSDFAEGSVTDVESNSTAGSISKVDTLSSPRTSQAPLWRPSDELPVKKEATLASMEIEFAAPRRDSNGDNSVLKKTSFEKHPTSMVTKIEHNSASVIREISQKEQIPNPISSKSHEHTLYSPVRKNVTDLQNRAESFGLNLRNPERFVSNSDVSSPISKSPSSASSSSESLNSIREVILRRNSHFPPSDIKYRRSVPSYRTENTDSVFTNKDYILERQTFGGGLIRRNPLHTRSYPMGNSESLHNRHEAFMQRRQYLGSIDLCKKRPGSISSYRTDSSESLASSCQGMLDRRSSFGSTDLRKLSNLSFTSRNNSNTDEENGDESSSVINHTIITDTCDGRESFGSADTVNGPDGHSSSDDDISFNSMEEMTQEVENAKSEDTENMSSSETNDSLGSTFNLEKPIKEEDVREQEVEQRRKSVVVEAKTGLKEFSPEDYALRSRVLILLWVLLGERRLREVGYPKEPVHRLLWRAVDICCSVAGVKSAAAIPLNPDHDCGSDMMCFRDHTHRFLEVCAPTRELWKQFGWASLTVDAVVRKIYLEELMPVLRILSLPSDIQKAAAYLAQLDRPTVMVANPAQKLMLKSEPKQQTVAAPPKKKRGRPAKISHKIEEGGRIERVMLWRFLLNLLEDPKNSPCIHWVQRDEGIFRILNTDWLARLWGRRHGNPRMTYEKMARAMRTYYRSKVLQPVPRLRNLPRKLVYKFNPAVIQKVAAMKLSCSTFTGRGMNYNK